MLRLLILLGVVSTLIAAGAASTGCIDNSCEKTLTCPSVGHSTGNTGGSGGTTASQGGANALLGLGDECSTPAECASAFCSDGVCCETACDGICASCDLDNNLGSCSSDPSGTDPADDCVGEAACDGAGACLYAEHLWSKKFGASGGDQLNDIATDPQGNVVIVGFFAGAVNFGGSTLTSAGGADIFVAKYDASGNHIWSKRFGDSGTNQSATALAIDGQGNIVFGGQFVGTLNLGGTNLVNSDAGPDLYVAKLSPSGAHIWSKSFAVTGATSSGGGGLRDLAVDATGNIVVTGVVDDDVNFGGSTLAASGASEAYLAKLTPTGGHSWSKIFIGLGSQIGWSLAALPAGDVVLSGTFVGGNINLGGGPLTPLGDDVFLARFSATGAHVWSTRFGNDTALPWSLAAVADGILIGGMFETSIDFGGGTMMAAGERDGFIVLFSGSGVHQWSKRLGSAARDVVTDVAFDSAGHVILSGYTQGSVDLGGGSLVSAGGDDVFIGKLDSSGEHVWSNIFGSGVDQLPDGLAVGDGDAVIVGGPFEGTLNFGGSDLVSSGGDDVFLAALGP